MSKRFLARLLALTMCMGLFASPMTAYAAEVSETDGKEAMEEEKDELSVETEETVLEDEVESDEIVTEKTQNPTDESDEMEYKIEVLYIGSEPPVDEADVNETDVDAASPDEEMPEAASTNDTERHDFDIAITEYTFPEYGEFPLDEDLPSVRVKITSYGNITKYYNNTHSRYFDVDWPLGNHWPWNSLTFYFDVTPNKRLEVGTYKDTIKISASNSWNEPMGECFLTLQVTVKPKIELKTIEARSNISDILINEKETKDPLFSIYTTDTTFFEKDPPNTQFRSYWEKKNGDEWQEYQEDTFTLGTYRYRTYLRLYDEYVPEYKLYRNTAVYVDGQLWTTEDVYEDRGRFVRVISPEFECTNPALSNVKLEGDELSWDPFEDEDTFNYLVKVGKYECEQFECSINLKDICEAKSFYGGTYPVEVVARDYDGEAISQVYKLEYNYDGPLPTERTVISNIELTSDFMAMFKEGNPRSNLVFSNDIPCVDFTSDFWWEICDEDGWHEYTEPTFGEGIYRYKLRVCIRPEYLDQYMLDPDLTMTVDKHEWTGGEVKLDYNDEVEYKEFTSSEYVLPIPEKEKITAITANTDDLSEYVVKGAELILPEFTDIDREEVEIMGTSWAMFDNGEPKLPEGNTFTSGKWCLLVGIRLKEDYKETLELQKTTTLTVNGTEWTNITGTSDPYYGIYFISPEYEIEDDEPVDPYKPHDEVEGTWVNKWGNTYYETEEGEKLTGIQKIDGEYYLFSKNGTLQSDVFYEEEGNKYYFGKGGKMVTGWFDKWGATYYANADGVMQTGFVDIDGDTYYFKADGKQTKSTWITVGDTRYYTKATGKLAKSETILKWGKKYTFDDRGALVP